VETRPSTQLLGAKALARLAAKRRRDSLSLAQRATHSAVIARHVDSDVFALLPRGATIALYANKQSEVATLDIEVAARSRGLRVCYPKTLAGHRRLGFFYAEAADLAIGTFGIAEPSDDAVSARESDIAAVIIPSLAVDRNGGRIGWGKGYYDATLPLAHNAVRVAVVFDCQWVMDVHATLHDVNVNLIITELESYRVQRSEHSED
jgi:5-formyltetrahydrofolate cyclo-ligase